LNHLKERQVSRCLAIIGASGHGKVIAEIAELLGYEVCFFDDAYPVKNNVEHWPIKGTRANLLANNESYFGAFVAIGHAATREQINNELQSHNIHTPSLVHPTAIVSQYAKISHACVIMPGAVVNAFSQIGAGSIINSNAVVEHDCKLGDCVHICPNAAVAGATTIGDRTWVGIGASVRQLINIGADVLIGAGSVVVNDTPENVTVVGIPAKAIN
jgi:sugar O-acyltransferase (sialic acid O-acetyltransferase NeuD family)